MKFSPVVLVALVALIGFGPRPILRGADDPTGYNVLFLMSDEHNPRVLGCYGDPLVKTPTLDNLAATGVRFTAAYCQNPICVPSRVALVSGRMPSNLNTFGNTANQKYRNITTLADLCGRPKPTGLEGSSLLPVLQGKDDGRDRIALSENYRGNFGGRMIRTARWKYFFYTNGEEFLYDLEQDPLEESNLIADPQHRKLADELKARATAGWVQAKRNIRDIVGAPTDASGTPDNAKPKRKKKQE
ncbi:MAG: DUF4976 domain-containing protein [Opitutus sp.]|nr:DUF4976 domain-containing protein [Opitutus sp.]